MLGKWLTAGHLNRQMVRGGERAQVQLRTEFDAEPLTGGLPISVTTGSASPHESKLVQGLFEFMLSRDTPQRIIGDKAHDSEDLDDECIGMIVPHRKSRKQVNATQDCCPLRRYKGRWTVERTISWF